jgi:ribosomal protein L37AE/L43A
MMALLPSPIGAADHLAVMANLDTPDALRSRWAHSYDLKDYRRGTMAEIVDQGVASCPRCGTTAPYAIEKTGGGQVDSVVSCLVCGKFRVERIAEHEDFSPGQ